ncbi:small ribosomal subunit Rsm22 family protein [Streptomyces sp. N2-109]|uniref:Small ribosomal subunit Rsm22 family protein n=1 Tax=Streptomyces gossypii TaxID=2883101 RepID=A0ABT2JRM7_9ACTN|nr:small ribosomal subunit Rsm22 family protein [Streptomyces gossypii]MCT2590149.1 small ribosomal subunit Rsm22 family protein [Streptomyces gossypii]
MSSPPVEEQLRVALAGLVDGLPARQASTAVDRLIAHYRGTTPTHTPVLRDHADVVAYAAYRMPATFEAVVSALTAFADRAPHWSPASHLDVGGGTGAAVWAASLVWGDGPGADSGEVLPVRRTTVLDWAQPALALGRELAGGSASASLRAARWETGKLSATALAAAARTERTPAPAPPVELVTVSYVLGELTAEDRRETVAAAARAGRAVVVVEPGTPDGYLRVREARDLLVDAGLTVLAPCPHSAACPLTPGEDWCHFAARVSRSSLHRQVKGGSLPYEDEKFSYVAAMRPGAVNGTPAGARIVRKPQLRKGQVLLDLCGAGEVMGRTTVSKRHGALYREAREAAWGGVWPPEQGPDEP